MKKSICILLLVVSIIILLSGLTMSYFHDKSDKIQIPFTMGTLEVEITEFPGNKEDWKPGETKQLEWSFENVGSQPAKLMVKLEGEWNKGELDVGTVDLDINKYYSNWERAGSYYVYNGPVDKNETVSIGFSVSLNEGSITPENYESYEGANYKITLTIEAIQDNGSWE